MALLLQRSTNSLTSRLMTNGSSQLVRMGNSKAASNKTPPKSNNTQENVELPGFSLKSLEMSPGVKVVVYGALAVIGTAEMITYGSWAYNKLYPKENSGGLSTD